MCGIAGIVARGTTLDVERQRRNVSAMLAAMTHRGPDDEALVVDQERCILGFRRLSIIDVEGGRQPIASEDRRVLAIANGEIYNHRELRDRLAGKHTFASHSDCEVLPHLYEEYGTAFVEHLNGMYGIALWDAGERRLVLVRDRLGVKPLYYHVTPSAVIFASELKGLFAHPDVPVRFDWQHALEFTYRRWIGFPGQRPTSWFKDIEYLPAGHMVTVARDGDIAERAYWALPREIDDRPRTEEQWVAGYKELLDDAVRLQLAADVEVGLFLSGGIDSVAIAHLARHHGQFHTFSIASPGTFLTGDVQNAADAAAAIGHPHHEGLMDDGFELTVDSWRELLRVLEQPLATIEQLYKYRLHRFARVVRPRLKVILLGQGSDEFNGGYGYFWLARNASPDAPRDWATFKSSVRRSQMRSMATFGDPQLLKIIEMFNEPILKADYVASFGNQEYEQDYWHYYLDMQRHMLQRFNLWHEDRTASANSIENRVPFLDHRLCEYTARMPEAARPSLLWDKSILRRALGSELPDRFTQRPKVPFVTMLKSMRAIEPLWNLLQANDCAFLDAAIDDSSDAKHIFDRDALRASVKTMRDRTEVDWIMMVLSLCFMERVMREPRSVPTSTIPAPPVLEGAAREARFATWSQA
jgi:asparagine synthase (glutamine-hydrolysing)